MALIALMVDVVGGDCRATTQTVLAFPAVAVGSVPI
jgi:hypothetical protein